MPSTFSLTISVDNDNNLTVDCAPVAAPAAPAPAAAPARAAVTPARKPATTHSVIDHRGFVIFSHQSKRECQNFIASPDRNRQTKHAYRVAKMIEVAE